MSKKPDNSAGKLLAGLIVLLIIVLAITAIATQSLKSTLIAAGVSIGIIFVIGIIAYFLQSNERNKNRSDGDTAKIPERTKRKVYCKKNKYLTNCEQEYYFTIKNIVSPKYLIYPQIPLTQIVQKISNEKYHNELFRVIDFCIFDTQFKPLICIEVNDETHRLPERYKRDLKVKEILKQAEIPLITLWTSFEIDSDYITKRIKEHIAL